MSKTKEELDALKEKVKTVNEKLQELTEEELEQVTGGGFAPYSNYAVAPGFIIMEKASLFGVSAPTLENPS